MLIAVILSLHYTSYFYILLYYYYYYTTTITTYTIYTYNLLVIEYLRSARNHKFK